MKNISILANYQTGNAKVTLLSDGTKILEYPDGEDLKVDFPLSMDIKITNYCDLNCAWCHEKSSRSGTHGDLNELKEILKELPKGTELAIGGGDPLSHPRLLFFLIENHSEKHFIVNLTINYKHIERYLPLLNYLIDNKLIYGLGISVEDDYDDEIIKLIQNRDNVVLHVIAGVNEVEILSKIKNSNVINKVLILGYKNFGRGSNYMSSEVIFNLAKWEGRIGNFLRTLHLSFDNLALDQLNIKNHLTNEEWNNFYMGDDGTSTMYIDLVKRKYAKTSTSLERYSLDEYSLKEFFEILIKKG